MFVPPQTVGIALSVQRLAGHQKNRCSIPVGYRLFSRGSVVRWGTMLQAWRSWVRDSIMNAFFFSIYLILPAALGPGVYSASNRNEYQKQKKNIFMWSRARPVRKADSLNAICESLSRQCRILNISQPYRPSRPVTGIALYTTLLPTLYIYIYFRRVDLFYFPQFLCNWKWTRLWKYKS
jgi:hypothetical protein